MRISFTLAAKPLSQRMLFAGGALLFLVLSMLFLVWIRISQTQSGYTVAKLEMEQIALQEQFRALKLEIAVLKRPERILRIAIQELNLTMPTQHQIIQFPTTLDF